MMQEFLLLFLKASAIYFLSINVVYALLLVLSWMEIKSYEKKMKAISPDIKLPGLSFVVPAYNEASLIVETINTYLTIPGLEKEIIVINDGSHDRTFELLQNMYQLRREFATSQIFRSITHPDLKVLNASRLGKSEALNFGVTNAKYDLICTMDADTVPNAKGVKECLISFANDPELVAAGGVIQVLKEETANNSMASRLHTFQRIEYLRTFLCERLGWGLLNSTLLISGAFCMIKKDALGKIGGFRKSSITEDFDLIVRLRRAYLGQKGNFAFIPVTTCHTQVPGDLKHLMVQRMRWQMGLVDTLFHNFPLLLNFRHGALGLFAVPYFWFVEMLSPFVEALAWFVIPYALFQEWIPLDVTAMFLMIGIFFNLIITQLGTHLDNKYVSRSKQWNSIKNALDTIYLHLGYRQITSWWRLLANFRAIKKTRQWGVNTRREINIKS